MKPKRIVPKIGFPSDFENLNETHEKILTLAENLVGTKGVFGLELKSIASTLNVSPSLIHHYYKNAEVLVFDTVLYSYSRTINSIQSSTAGENDPEVVARAWVEGMLEWTTKKPGIGVILEFPRGVLRTGTKSADNSELLLLNFLKIMSKYGLQNVAYMCSSVRALQKNQEFKSLSPAKIATLIATDRKFAMYVSLFGFATIGGGLWMAGRRPADKKNPTWLNLGFNPDKQVKNSIDEFISLVKRGD